MQIYSCIGIIFDIWVILDKSILNHFFLKQEEFSPRFQQRMPGKLPPVTL